MASSMVVHGDYSITEKAESGGPQVQGQHGLGNKTLSQTKENMYVYYIGLCII